MWAKRRTRLTNQHPSVGRQNRRCCGLTWTRTSQICSSIIVPLLLFIFTIFIAIYQQKISNSNRLADLEMAREQREQDRQASDEQRFAEMNATAQRRREDQEAAKKKLENRWNITQDQREIERNSSAIQLAQELLLAEQLAKISALQHQKDLETDETLRQEKILSIFIREVSALALAGGNSRKIANGVIIRWKLLIALRQLNGVQKAVLFRFLYDAGLFEFKLWQTTPPYLDLDEINFDHLNLTLLHYRFTDDDMSSHSYLSYDALFTFKNSYWASASFIQAKFDNLTLHRVTFEGAILTNASFRYARLEYVHFIRAVLIETDFEGASLIECDFTEADLTGSNLSDQQLASALFIQNAILPDRTIGVQHPHKTLQSWLPIPCVPWGNTGAVPSSWKVSYDMDENPNVSKARITTSQTMSGECRFEARARHQIGMRASIELKRIWSIRDDYIANKRIFLAVTMECTSYGENMTILYVVKQYDTFGKLLAISSAGPKFHSNCSTPIWKAECSSKVHSDIQIQQNLYLIELDITFKNTVPGQMHELIGYCQNLYIAVIPKGPYGLAYQRQ